MAGTLYGNGTAGYDTDSEQTLLVKLVNNTADQATNSNPSASSGLPYGADEMVYTNGADGPTSIVFKRGGATLKTRTITYVGGMVTHSVDT